MQVVKLRKVGNMTVVELPTSVLEALHLHENDDIVIEVSGERIMPSRVTPDFQDAWEAYKGIEPQYRNTNRKLAE